jgi:protein-disulfide isomerase
VFFCAAAPALASPGRYLASLKAGPGLAFEFLTRNLPERPVLRSKIVAGLMAILMTGGVYFVLPPWLIAHRGRTEASATGEDRVEKHFRQPVMELRPSAEGMTQGNPDADLRIVVFTDFKCPFCGKFDRQLKDLLARRPGGYFVSYKHFPLSRECNPLMKQAAFDHAQACRLALVAEAMGELGFFEEWGSELYLEGVTELYPALKEIAMRAGEDMHVWAGLSQGPGIQERVERDIEEGLRLGLRGVPAIFVNGRQLASTDPGKVEEIFEAIESGRFSDFAE